MEIIIALAVITIIFAAVLPQFRIIRNSWDSRQAGAEAVQNGRILMDHISRNLSQALRITAVSQSSDTDGYINFADYNGDVNRYDVNSDSNYVEFGPPDGLSDLAGPVSLLRFTCYDANVDTPVTDVNIIRVVKVDATIINSSSLGQDKTFTTWAYLRTNDESSDCWQNDDIGEVGAAGSATESDGIWTIEGSGIDLGPLYTADEFHFVYQALSGDGQIIARVVSIEDTGDYAKAGVMIRETLDDDSKYAGVFVTPDNGVYLQYRTTAGQLASYTAGSGSLAPCWLKVVRADNTFATYESADGSAWTQVGTNVSITMATDVYIGMAVCSGSDGDLCTAEIDNIGFSTVTYEEVTTAKVSSDSTSIAISTPGSSTNTVTILGSWLTGTTHAKESGTNRALIFIAHEESVSGSPTLTSVTYGGQTMTKVIERSAVSGSYGNYIAAFILNESGVDAASGSDFSVTWSATTSSVSYASVFLSNVNQTTLTGASASNGTTTGTDPITTSALSTSNGDMVILGATCGNNGSYTLGGGFTEGTDQSVGINGHTGVTGYKSATGANETPSADFSATVNRQVIIGFVVQVNEEVGDIEGDLLIAAVATDGDASSSLGPVGDDWNEIDVNDYSNAVTLGAWWKFADAYEPASHEFTWSGAQQAYGWMMHFTGHNATTPINAYSSYGQSSTSPTSPEVTTTVDNCLILRLGAFDNDNITVGSPGLTTPILHTAITMDKSSTSSSVAAEILGSWVTGTTHTKEAGTNRALIFIAHEESVSGSPTVTSVTYGGRTMTKVIERSAVSGYGNYVVAFILNESGVDAATNGTFTVAWSAATSSVSYASVFLSNVNQTTLTGASASNGTTTGTDPITTSALSTSNGDMVILGATCGNNGSYTLGGGFTEGTDQSVGTNGHTGVTGYKSATGANETPSADYSATVNRQVIIGFVVQHAVLEDTVSGGAGYVGQAISGDSGTSNFSLTSSNASQMLTIAIAPAPDTGCTGDIYP